MFAPICHVWKCLHVWNLKLPVSSRFDKSFTKLSPVIYFFFARLESDKVKIKLFFFQTAHKMDETKIKMRCSAEQIVDSRLESQYLTNYIMNFISRPKKDWQTYNNIQRYISVLSASYWRFTKKKKITYIYTDARNITCERGVYRMTYTGFIFFPVYVGCGYIKSQADALYLIHMEQPLKSFQW